MLSHLIESVPERGRFRKNLPGDQPGVRGARARSGAAHPVSARPGPRSTREGTGASTHHFFVKAFIVKPLHALVTRLSLFCNVCTTSPLAIGLVGVAGRYVEFTL